MIQIKRKQPTAAQMPAEYAQKPPDATEAPQAKIYAYSNRSGVQGTETQFIGNEGKRYYRDIYRAAFDYHERHILQRNSKEISDTAAAFQYWENALNDLEATKELYNNDTFLTELLLTVYDELSRNFKTLKELNAETGNE